jgi:hypothetical protein
MMHDPRDIEPAERPFGDDDATRMQEPDHEVEVVWMTHEGPHDYVEMLVCKKCGAAATEAHT